MNKQTKVVVAIGVILAGAFALSSVLYKENTAEKLEKVVADAPSTVVRPSAKFFGPIDAKVHIVEFMDPGCETCKLFHPFLHALVESNRGKVRVSIRYLPLHHGADTMAMILEAAGKQGKYWEALELMFAHQHEWASHHRPEPERIWPLLPTIGLDVEAIRRDMASPEIAAIIKKDKEDARTLGLRKTPSFFVNGDPLLVFGHEQLRALVDQAVAATY